MALASALASAIPAGSVASGRKSLVGLLGVVRANPATINLGGVNPAAAVTVVPAATLVIPRNVNPGHWPGAMQILDEPRTDRLPAWNYKARPMNKFWKFFDQTTDRFDEFTRIVVVDGNIGAGKTTIAKRIAKAFDMIYMPEPDSRLLYNNDAPLNFDLRDPVIQAKLHPRNRKYDLDDFYTDPQRRPARAAEMQIDFLKLRYHQYAEACVHLLSTGQGVVLDRSIFSDHVFAETMRDHGMFPKKAYHWYHFVRRHTICNFWKPHLTVYLDCPVDVCLQRIQERGIPSEVNSKFLNEDYLLSLEKHYKSSFLPQLEKSGEMLISEYPDYDGDEGIEAVLEEITRLDFSYELDDAQKFEWWRTQSDEQITQYRIECTNEEEIDRMLDPPGRWRVEELWKDGQLEKEMEDVRKAFDDYKTPYGYKKGFDDNKKMMLDFGRTDRRSFKFLDNIPTPVLGPQYAEVPNPNNPLAHALVE